MTITKIFKNMDEIEETLFLGPRIYEMDGIILVVCELELSHHLLGKDEPDM